MENFNYRLELCKNIFKEFHIFENKYKTILEEFSTNIKNSIVDYRRKGGFDLSKGIISAYLLYVLHTIDKTIKNVTNYLDLIKGYIDNINSIISSQNLSVLKEIDDGKENIKKLLLKINSYKSSYYEKMNNAEKSIFLYEQSLYNNEQQKNKNSLLKNQNDLIKKAKIAEKEYNDYINKINEQRIIYYKNLSNFIINYREFNLIEVQTLYNLFTTFFKIKENELDILNTGKLYFHNNLNNSKVELNVPLPNDDEINFSYEIEPYISSYYKFISPDNNNNNNENQIYQQVINKLKNEFTSINENIYDTNSFNDYIKFTNILYHITYYCSNIKDEEIESMNNFFKQQKYRDKFILHLNNLRRNLTLFNDPKAFLHICKLFNLLFKNIDISDSKEHNNVCFAILLSQTFYTNYYGEKIFIVHNLNLNFNESMFIDFIENEIESHKIKENIFITVVSFSAHLKDILKEKSKIMTVFNHFIEKYKFNEKEINDIKEQLKDIKEEEKKEEGKKEEGKKEEEKKEEDKK